MYVRLNKVKFQSIKLLLSKSSQLLKKIVFHRIKLQLHHYKQFLIQLILGDDLLFWSIEIIKNRLWYKFYALYHGILINKNAKANSNNFRRNIHRIEKGLSYPQIKTIFAEDYIWETVSFLKEDRLAGYLDNNTRRWGEAVLDLYFQTCKHSDRVTESHKLYLSIKSENLHKDWVPYLSNMRPKASVSYEALHQLALRRRSVRFYLEKKVEPHLIEKAMKIATLSPSACNRQSFKFLFFNDKSLVQTIAQVPGGVRGYEIPSIVVVVGSYKGYFDVRDINAPTIDSSLAVMSFLFALETLELSSVCINWPNVTDKEKQLRKIIEIKNDEFIVMSIGVGYSLPEGKIPYSAKRELNDLLLINQRIKPI